MNNFQELPLRDIHLPDPVSWWPPALGWWLVVLTCILFIITAITIYRYYQRKAVFRAALHELKKIEVEYKHQLNLRQLAVNLSELIRRTSISVVGRKRVAALSGEHWLAWLDKQANTNDFSEGPGQHLLNAPYQSNPEFHPDTLIRLCRYWIKTVATHLSKELKQ